MKYELLVEYPITLHPNMDLKVIKAANCEPYDASVNRRTRTLEFAYLNKSDYEQAYERLSKQKEITVIAGNK